jgi:prefoldin subunit 5
MEQAMREKQIPAAIARINSVVDQLEKQIAEYTDTASAILSPSLPIGVGTDKALKSPEALAPLAQMLGEIESRIRSISNKMNELRSRTEA